MTAATASTGCSQPNRPASNWQKPIQNQPPKSHNPCAEPLVAATVDIPLAKGAVIIGFFALLHGHAHGSEIPETVGGVEYLAGFALATAVLHGAGIGLCLLSGQRFRGVVRLAGAAIAAAGFGLMVDAV
ncbi:HupE/UreJ family protein [Mesorhizobium sp.]|uniref:HupE/UreJ family protein n=1 Tax=Mesorhizobium sp. TaxID=1871066 RepID=UPI000FEA5C33|nr:HupE/UreJ family protein [Mesorhizobium sp.]RWI99872.1 MAG: HupE/UreJ family protein [Mesorhizobium sp.]TIP95007.1 MAG: HupE/UreJ family protein [Mesorhizobium sp.]